VKSSVLIIENDPQVLDTVKVMVEITGRHAIGVRTADAALTALSKQAFDVVPTSSLHVSTLKMIALPWLAKQVQPTTAVVLTAAGQPVDRTDLGSIDAFLPKPFSITDIARTIASLPQAQRAPQAPVPVAENV